MASAVKIPRPTLVQLWKRGWNEIPEVMGSTFFLICGVIGVPYVLYDYYKYDRGNHRYKVKYVVYRPEDPRVQRIRRFDDSPPTTRSTPGC